MTNNLPKEKVVERLQESVQIMVTFATIVLILLVAHEFRYNTINYSLTISNSRSKVLASKLIVGIVFTVATTALAIAFAFGVAHLAIAVKDLNLPAQDFNWLYIIARLMLYCLGGTLFFMGLTLLVRNLTASIAAAFVLPTIDGLAGLLLSTRNIDPAWVLPFTTHERFGNVVGDLLGNKNIGETFMNMSDKLPPSPYAALGIFGIYFVVLWVVTWILFLRRDAN